MAGIDGLAALSEGFCPLGHGRLRATTIERVAWCHGCGVGWATIRLYGAVTGAVDMTTRDGFFATDEFIRCVTRGQPWVFGKIREAAMEGRSTVPEFGQWEPIMVDRILADDREPPDG